MHSPKIGSVPFGQPSFVCKTADSPLVVRKTSIMIPEVEPRNHAFRQMV